jgi:hypothetical protein
MSLHKMLSFEHVPLLAPTALKEWGKGNLESRHGRHSKTATLPDKAAARITVYACRSIIVQHRFHLDCQPRHEVIG